MACPPKDSPGYKHLASKLFDSWEVDGASWQKVITGHQAWGFIAWSYLIFFLFPECDVNVTSMFLAPSAMSSQMIGMALCHVMIENGEPK